ncbi:S-adenosyl-L-methionine-dependent methyltransferase [Cercophora newfieldiana]|uniref:S-adenosyl-L-methionine-dependent methyltransferase n=1 Tax=Cercophora newfieldiana TaxID=92897 RepID=A0AA39YAZ9_9PEZI|nr:S-adenosyl-L-methionine-dependent methyltransferase [Cercophora newfieldiana]
MAQNPPNGDHEPAAPIPVDPEFIRHNDDDSALGDCDIASLHAEPSLHGSVLQFREIHGRTYHNFGSTEYWGPNDNDQNDGLDLHHQALLILNDGKLFRSPLENPQAILDVGTGTGLWAVQVADEYPSAQVVGTDLSPIQPSWVPPNCRFELDDMTQPWTYDENHFDLIHIRCLMGSIEDWTKLYSEAFRCLKPGGWLEHTDFAVHITSDDGSVPPGSVYDTWNRIFAEAGARTNKTFAVDDGHMARCMEEAGFSGPINIKDHKLPLGAWPAERKWKEIGGYVVLGCDYGLEGYVLYVTTNVLGWELHQVQELLQGMRAAFRNQSWHAHFPW